MLEISNQHIEQSADSCMEPILPQFRMPLTGLIEEALSTYGTLYVPSNVRYPLSNDECTAPYFEQLSVRKDTAEYKSARHRVAVLVGESALAANLRYIPEETIILLDYSPDMCMFMQEYVAALRTSRNPEEWAGQLVDMGPMGTATSMNAQYQKWGLNGLKHPLADDAAFKRARDEANDKCIIPWCADITEDWQMDRLGDALSDREAVVTMMNLTNVLPYTRAFDSPKSCAEQLGRLPVGTFAPILTTSIRTSFPRLIEQLARVARNGSVEGGEISISLEDLLTLSPNVVMGPYFGLDNLARAMDDSHLSTEPDRKNRDDTGISIHRVEMEPSRIRGRRGPLSWLRRHLK